MSELKTLVVPPHKCGFTVEHNPHKNYYESVSNFLKRPCPDGFGANDDEREEAIRTNEIWSARWYPDTPVGCHFVSAATFETLMEIIKEMEE